jgi:RNA polymerase sigma-70 factor (ECF subfamily)
MAPCRAGADDFACCVHSAMSDSTTRPSLLIRLKKDGDAAAWSEFDAIYRPMLRRVAQARGLSESDADDVVQHCLVAVLQHIKSFEYDRSKGRFKSWLCTLINNRVRNLRREQHGVELPADFADPAQHRELAPDEEFERAWMEEHLRFALQQIKDTITPVAYAAYRRHVLEGEDVEAVCRAFSLTPGQLYKVKWRVTQKLQARLRDILPVEEDPPTIA